MSTKTTLKRIALVAVSALGFGLMTAVAPANATDTGKATGFTLSRSSITVVGSGNSVGAIFQVQLANSAGTTTATNKELVAGETLTVSVVGVPTSVSGKTLSSNSADLVITEGKLATDNGVEYASTFSSNNTGGTGTATDGTFTAGQDTYKDGLGSSAAAAVSRSYFFSVTRDAAKDVLDQGEYTLRVRLVNGDILVKEELIKVTFVSTAADLKGATLTVSDVGAFYVGLSVSEYDANNYITATLRDVNSGLVINANGTSPEITIDTVSSTGTATSAALSNGTLALVDDGTSADFGYVNAFSNIAFNGVYGATWTSPALASETNRIRVRYGALSNFSTVLVYAAATGNTASSSATVTGTGIVAGSAGSWTLPVSTKSAVVTVTVKNSSNTAVQDYPVTFTTTWTGVAAGDQTPLSGADGITIVKTNSEGKASITITNGSPDDADNASVAITGTGASITSQSITWAKSKAASVSSSPNSGFTALVGSSNTITWTFLDAFGAPVAGEVINLAITGTGTNSAGTRVIPSVVTDANGQVSYTWTSTAIAAQTDIITATSSVTGSVNSSVTVTFAATVPVIATLTGRYNTTEDAGTYPDLVGTAVIAEADPLNIDTNMVLTRSLDLAAEQGGQIAFRYEAKTSAGVAATGVPVTVKISDGGHILSAAGLPVTERIIYPVSGNVDFKVTATTVGVKTITLTAGTVTATAMVEFENALTDARTVAVMAGSKAGSYTATVTDRFGNAVSGVDLTIIVSGDGRLATGGKSVQWTTTSSGSYDFDVVGAGPVAIQVSGAATGGQLSDIAGVVGTADVAGVAAGVKTVTLSAQTPAPDAAAEAAQAAADAAAEAIDAANAATDAANLAAEAADAATVAAEEARDAADAATAAVEELATQVATLFAALRAQLTTLANTVAKIAKKVRA
jgi:hypothetical protein